MCATASSQAANLPMTSSEKDSISASATASSPPIHALNRLDAQTLEEQEMTDQELKTIGGGASNSETANGLYGALSSISDGMIWLKGCGEVTAAVNQARFRRTRAELFVGTKHVSTDNPGMLMRLPGCVMARRLLLSPPLAGCNSSGQSWALPLSCELFLADANSMGND
jgi:hypothetical protein